jgi:hypothetical protein
LGIDRRDAGCQHGKPHDLPYHLMRINFHIHGVQKAIAAALNMEMCLRSVAAVASFA